MATEPVGNSQTAPSANQNSWTLQNFAVHPVSATDDAPQSPEMSSLQHGRSNDGPDGLKIWNCTNCRRRKVRCDRQYPCVPCVRHGVECVFPISGRLPRRGHKKNPAAGPAPVVDAGVSVAEVPRRHSLLLARLRKLESLVSELSSQVESAAMEEGVGMDGLTAALTATVEVNGSDANGIDDPSSPEEQQVRSSTGSAQVTTPDFLSGSTSLDTPLWTSTNGRVGELVTQIDGDLIVEDRFWTIFCNEVEQIFEAVRDHRRPPFFENTSQQKSSSRSSEVPSMEDARPHLSYFSYLLRQAGGAQVKMDLFPLPSQMPFLWQAFEERVDPFVKILHVPTMSKIIRQLNGNWSSLKPGMSALIFAISFAATSAFDDAEVRTNFNLERSDLLGRFREGTEMALEHAQLLKTRDLAVVQAYTIYLSVLQSNGNDSDSLWALVGVLVRVAVRLQLHVVDGAESQPAAQMSPFEAEMRRRLWWQICLLDSRTVRTTSSRFLVSFDMFSTKMPKNVNDLYFDTESSEIPTSSRRTEMTPTLYRFNIWRLLQTIRSRITNESLSPLMALESVNDGIKTIQETWGKELDPANPVDAFVRKMADLSFDRIKLVLNQKLSTAASSTDGTASEAAFLSSLSILETHWALHDTPSWRPWRWLLPKRSTPWSALSVALRYITSTAKQIPDLSKAQCIIEKTFNAIPQSEQGTPLYQALARAVAQARTQVHASSAAPSNPSADNMADIDFGTDSYRESFRAALASLNVSGTDSNPTLQPPPPQTALIPDVSQLTNVGQGSEMDLDWPSWDPTLDQSWELDTWAGL